MERGEEDQISSSISHIKNLTSLTTSKYNELNVAAGHVVRTDERRTTKKVFNAKTISTRKMGRPNLRWIDGLEIDLLVLRTKNWRTLAGKRLAWKRLLEKRTFIEFGVMRLLNDLPSQSKFGVYYFTKDVSVSRPFTDLSTRDLSSGFGDFGYDDADTCTSCALTKAVDVSIVRRH
ncbi:uncharacterized protein TNCV_436151 [Trichonephila clavipes]|nr:uncharacterized protein TNCV_436151 [Trichonephila clavipes]